MRAAGLSARKVEYLVDLALHFDNGALHVSKWVDMPDEEIIDESNRRYSSMAILLRSRYLVDVDCWSEVRGQPLKPSTVRRVLLAKLAK